MCIGNSDQILIIKGDNSICYGILESYSCQLRDALRELGEDVVYIDLKVDDIINYIYKKFKAVIAFMDVVFYNQIPNSDAMLFDLIQGPKFNYWLDHPVFLYRYKNRFPKDYYILTHDRNYVKFINEHYKKVTAFFFPPGGKTSNNAIPFEKREYDVSFLGAYSDYRKVIRDLTDSEDIIKKIVKLYFDFMIDNPDLTAESAFKDVLDSLGIEISEENFMNNFSAIQGISVWGTAYYYREKIIDVLLENKITIDVFGDSWKDAPFFGNKYLRVHPAIEASKVSEIYGNSKISLNVMSWHKDSITERVLDAMMAGSIVVTDSTDAIKEAFEDSILTYSLKQLDEIPKMIYDNLNNYELAEMGRIKVYENYRWKSRAKDLLNIIGRVN